MKRGLATTVLLVPTHKKKCVTIFYVYNIINIEKEFKILTTMFLLLIEKQTYERKVRGTITHICYQFICIQMTAI